MILLFAEFSQNAGGAFGVEKGHPFASGADNRGFMDQPQLMAGQLFQLSGSLSQSGHLRNRPQRRHGKEIAALARSGSRLLESVGC
jgi:hypothetical protein